MNFGIQWLHARLINNIISPSVVRACLTTSCTVTGFSHIFLRVFPGKRRWNTKGECFMQKKMDQFNLDCRPLGLMVFLSKALFLILGRHRARHTRTVNEIQALLGFRLLGSTHVSWCSISIRIKWPSRFSNFFRGQNDQYPLVIKHSNGHSNGRQDFPLPRFSTEPAQKHTSSSPPSVALSCSDVVAERWGDRIRIHGVDVGKGTLLGNLRKHCVFF